MAYMAYMYTGRFPGELHPHCGHAFASLLSQRYYASPPASAQLGPAFAKSPSLWIQLPREPVYWLAFLLIGCFFHTAGTQLTHTFELSLSCAKVSAQKTDRCIMPCSCRFVYI